MRHMLLSSRRIAVAGLTALTLAGWRGWSGSLRMRAINHYRLDGDELLWDRSFGRPANAVVLPAGWYLTNSSIPATVSRTTDGRVRLDFINARNDNVDVLLTARRRP